MSGRRTDLHSTSAREYRPRRPTSTSSGQVICLWQHRPSPLFMEGIVRDVVGDHRGPSDGTR